MMPYHSILRVNRDRLRYTKRRMAGECGMPEVVYGQIEDRIKPAPLWAAFRIAEYLALDVVQIFGADGRAIQYRDSDEYEGEQIFLEVTE